MNPKMLLVCFALGAAACGSKSATSGNALADAAGAADTGIAADATPTDAAGDATATADAAAAADVAVGPCAPKPACAIADPSCIALADNTGKTQFGLRIAQIDFATPAVFASGPFGTMLTGATMPQATTCNLNGQGTFSWLLQFDTAAATLKTGGAKPVADPSAGYSFDDEVVSPSGASFHVQPVTLNTAPDASGKFTVATGADLILPVFLDASGTNGLFLPLRQARIATGTLTSHNNCIGAYNAAGLEPSKGCAPDAGHPQYLDAGSFDGFVTLEDADSVPLTAVGETLCVLLAGNPVSFSDGATPLAHCKRGANGKILFTGNWCAATDTAGSLSCADAVHVAGNFAASAVKILN